MNLTAMHAIFESLDDFGDVGDFEDPDTAIAQSALGEYNRRSDEHFDISKFVRAEKSYDEYKPMIQRWHSPLYSFYPGIKNLLPEVEVCLEVDREGPAARIQLKLVIWGNHIINDLLEMRGGRVIIYNGKEQNDG